MLSYDVIALPPLLPRQPPRTAETEAKAEESEARRRASRSYVEGRPKPPAPAEWHPMTRCPLFDLLALQSGQRHANDARDGHACGRGLHSSTFRLNVSALCAIGGSFKGCLGGV